jgi:hypothetical protein
MFPDNFRNLKAGVVCAAARIAPSTMRGLVALNLALGDRKGSGHPVYDFVDVVRLRLLQRLREDMKLEPPRAIRVVNSLSEALTSLAEEIPADLSKIKNADYEGGPWAIISEENDAKQFNKHVAMTLADLAETLGLAGEMQVLVIPLRPVVYRSIHPLNRVIFGEVGEYAE